LGDFAFLVGQVAFEPPGEGLGEVQDHGRGMRASDAAALLDGDGA